MKRHHKIAISAFGTITVIFMIVAGILLNGIILKQSIENKQLTEQISELKLDTNEKINELVSFQISENLGITDNLKSTNLEIDKLKVETASDFSSIFETSIESVVIIRTLSQEGSGFFINNEGYIVTNEHVLQGISGDQTKLIQIITSDGVIHAGKPVGFIKELDLALLKIQKPYPYLVLANSNELEIGERVIAIGTPQGLSFSATDGIVSAVKRTGPNNEPVYIQTNAQLNPGNSGGPLINSDGQVVGLNNFKLMSAEGIGFALESNKVKEGVNIISQQLLNRTMIQ